SGGDSGNAVDDDRARLRSEAGVGVELAAGNDGCSRWPGEGAVGVANPPARRRGGFLTVSPFNGRVCLQTRALSSHQRSSVSTVGCTTPLRSHHPNGTEPSRRQKRYLR